jgi:hypothetical protein
MARRVYPREKAAGWGNPKPKLFHLKPRMFRGVSFVDFMEFFPHAKSPRLARPAAGKKSSASATTIPSSLVFIIFWRPLGRTIA